MDNNELIYSKPTYSVEEHFLGFMLHTHTNKEIIINLTIILKQ